MAEVHCELCGEQAIRDTRPIDYTYKGHKITLGQPGTYCDSCGESLLEPEDLSATRIELMEFQARVDHILGPKQVKEIRKTLKRSQKQLADLLGGGPNAFSRYERGVTAVPKSVSVALKFMAKHPEEIEEIDNQGFSTEPELQTA